MNSNDLLASVRALNLKLSDAAARAVSEMSNPDVRLLTADTEGMTDRFTLVQGMWVETYPGVRMMLIDDAAHCGKCILSTLENSNCGCTRVLCEAKEPVKLPVHSHSYDETVTIIVGELFEHTAHATHSLKRPSDKITYRAGESHQPEIFGLVMICWHPPLQRIPVKPLMQ